MKNKSLTKVNAAHMNTEYLFQTRYPFAQG